MFVARVAAARCDIDEAWALRQSDSPHAMKLATRLFVTDTAPRNRRKTSLPDPLHETPRQ